ncbi:MAG: hypothetical protein AB1584_07785 [Pseudomonadota bacterium]
MKKTNLTRSAAALALVATLASCGGSTNYTIGGVVSGLQPGAKLVLTTNGMETTVEGKPLVDGRVVDVPYSFPQQLEYGEVYNVLPKQTGTNADGTPIYQMPEHQTCVASGRTNDTAGRLSEIRADYSCALVAPSIGGVVKGLTVGSVTLINGSTGGSVTIAAPETPGDVGFVFSAPVTWGQTYGVTVYSTEKVSCTVTNGTGTMGDNNVTNIEVNCVANPT